MSRDRIEYSIEEIRDRVSGDLEGAGNLTITGLEQIDRARTGDLTLIGAKQYVDRWSSSGASAAILQRELDASPGAGRALIRVADADLALATVLAMFARPIEATTPGVHPGAIVDAQAVLGAGVAVGAMSYVGPRVRIGDGTLVHPNVTIMEDVVVGAGCTLWPGVVIRERCEIGDGCILHSNVSIGGDGFGYRPAPDGRSLVKIPHIGTVRLGPGVELGAGTCVDRGKFSETEIGAGTKLDNLCQVGHNCRIGRSTVIAGLVGIGGSVTIGDGVMMGGGCVIKDHVTIGDGARLGGGSALMHDIPPGATWHGHPAHDAKAAFREFAALRRLPEFMRAEKLRTKREE